jgi:hypothetical protein
VYEEVHKSTLYSGFFIHANASVRDKVLTRSVDKIYKAELAFDQNGWPIGNNFPLPSQDVDLVFGIFLQGILQFLELSYNVLNFGLYQEEEVKWSFSLVISGAEYQMWFMDICTWRITVIFEGLYLYQRGPVGLTHSAATAALQWAVQHGGGVTVRICIRFNCAPSQR